MIRNVADVNALLDRRFGGAVGRPLSLLRTVVWVVVGIYLIGLLFPAPKAGLASVPYNKVSLRDTPVRDLILDKNDARGWTHRKKDPSKFTIAWVGGSTIQTVRRYHHGFIPVDVTKSLGKINGKPIRVNMYLMEASRIYDLYAATAEALRTKPDMLILDLNPIWMFNPNAIQGWPNFNPAVLRPLVADPANWPLLAAIDSPTDVALSASGSHLGAIRNRWSYAEKLRSLIDHLAPHPKAIDPAAPPPNLSGAALIATMQNPYAFWNRYRLIPLETPRAKRYPAYMAQARTDGSGLNDMIITRLLETIGGSGIPSLVYTSAVNPQDLADPAADATLHRIESRLARIASAHESRTMRVQANSAIRYVTGLKFRDMAHTTYDPPIVAYLSSLICTQLKAVHPATTCTPKARSATP